MLIKRFKNNVSLYVGSNYKNIMNMTTFYLLPTIEFFLDKSFDDDQSFDIKFLWLFWSFEISKCWGSVYKK